MQQTLLLATLDGLAQASVLFMVAVGLSLIFGIMRILNVAHGSFYALGAYSAVTQGRADGDRRQQQGRIGPDAAVGTRQPEPQGHG
ncbi:hypothetical protein LLE87_30930, partial [Paenibacillus polymyxa]|nr:hypothetical protein [Paenibacillus polymyxa]